MDKHRISIIIPVYNAEDYLPRCLDSILSQDMTSYEVILVDDGSTDSSSLICDRYSATDPRFRTIHKTNGGVSSARNAGLNLAKGEYVMFVDSDDALAAGALASMTEGLGSEDFVLGGFIEYLSDIPHRNVAPHKALSYPESALTDFYNANIRHNCEMLDAPWAKLFRRKTLGNLRFNEKLSYAEDKLFVFEFLTRCQSVYTCSERVYDYYLRSGSLGSDISSDRHLAQLQVFLPLYSDLLKKLTQKVPGSHKVAALYHRDLVGRYVCRTLNVIASRKTSYCNEGTVEFLYGLMREDASIGIFSLRAGQIINMILFKLGNPAFTVKFYRLTSGLASCFRRRLE